MVKVNWTPENDRKLLLQLIAPSIKDIPIDHIATLFPGATSKSIIERIAKLRREKKSSSITISSLPTTKTDKKAPATTVKKPSSAPTKKATSAPVGKAAPSPSPSPSPSSIVDLITTTTPPTTTNTSATPAKTANGMGPSMKGWRIKSAVTGEFITIADAPLGRKRSGSAAGEVKGVKLEKGMEEEKVQVKKEEEGEEVKVKADDEDEDEDTDTATEG